MANTLEYIRKLADIHRTPGNKGYELQITFRHYDNELVQVNGSPIRDGGDNPVLSGIRLMIEMVEELERQHQTRTEDAPPTEPAGTP